MIEDKAILIDPAMVEVHENFDGHLVVNRLWLKRRGYEGLSVIDRHLIERAVNGIAQVQRSVHGTIFDTLSLNPILDVTLRLEEPGHPITFEELRQRIVELFRDGTVYEEVDQDIVQRRAKLRAAKDFDEVTQILGTAFRWK